MQHMDVDPAYATFVGNAVGMKYKTMFVTQTGMYSIEIVTHVCETQRCMMLIVFN